MDKLFSDKALKKRTPIIDDRKVFQDIELFVPTLCNQEFNKCAFFHSNSTHCVSLSFCVNRHTTFSFVPKNSVAWWNILASKGARYTLYCFSFVFQQKRSQEEETEKQKGSKIFKIEKLVREHIFVEKRGNEREQREITGWNMWQSIKLRKQRNIQVSLKLKQKH